jgi:hypothetical protein
VVRDPHRHVDDDDGDEREPALLEAAHQVAEHDDLLGHARGHRDEREEGQPRTVIERSA